MPLAKRALTADKAKVANNAKKLGGLTAAQLSVKMRGPKGAAGPQGPPGKPAVTVHTEPFSLAPGANDEFPIACDAGEKALNGGFSSDALVDEFDTYPSEDGAGWNLFLVNEDEVEATGTLQVICIK